MQVILLERVAKLGQMGDVVDVKPGYARNFLLPQGKALTASAANVANFEAQKAQLEARNLETKKEAEALGEKLDGQQFIVIRSASDAGALYGSVTPRDAADAASEGGFSVDKKQVVLSRPIKELGLHDVHVMLHPEVDVTIQLNVARSAEEAELQASGKSIQELAAEAEAEAEFEIAELFEDIGAAADEDSDLVATPEDAAEAAEEDTKA
ncbi:50S ribosomal protein L9 [Shimia sp. SDUM112013]|uniref:50S ribosomal protein L9 n=1 Tax=Shimia sp. SDUM112013 TaxID=3136160 RepID=UPI0032EE733A